MTFTLTCLGTDTDFLKGLSNTEDYPLGETLSLASTLIKSQNQELSEQPSAIKHICSDSVCVVDGPTTSGSEVYDRIRQGLMSTLKAISRGKTCIQLIAHSRGACQSIIIAHHLDSIKKQLPNIESQDAFKTIVTNTLTDKSHVDETFFSTLNLEAFKANLQQVRVRMFLIDPVPGGRFFMVPGIKWDDERFYQLPEIVIHFQQVIFENERTRCFKAIVPIKNGQEFYRVDTLPGHHGTGSGNPYDQAKALRDSRHNYDKTQTQGVQQLIFSKLIQFLIEGGHELESPAQPHPHTQTLCQLATRVIQGGFEALQLELYSHIMLHLVNYQAFNATSYNWLGQEQSLQGLFYPSSVVQDRIIHSGSKADAFLSRVLPSERCGQFLNAEHRDLGIKSITKGLITEVFERQNPVPFLKELLGQVTSEKSLESNALLLQSIFDILAESYLNDQFVLKPAEQFEFVEILKVILTHLESTIKPQAMTESSLELASGPRARINAALSTKIKRLGEEVQQLLEKGLDIERSMDKQILKIDLDKLPLEIQELISELNEKNAFDPNRLKALKLQYQPQYYDDENDAKHDDKVDPEIFDVLEKWSPEGIKKQEISIFTRIFDRYHSCLNLRQHSEALVDYIDKHRIIRLSALISGLEQQLEAYVDSKNLCFLDIDRELEPDAKQLLPEKLLNLMIKNQFKHFNLEIIHGRMEEITKLNRKIEGVLSSTPWHPDSLKDLVTNTDAIRELRSQLNALCATYEHAAQYTQNQELLAAIGGDCGLTIDTLQSLNARLSTQEHSVADLGMHYDYQRFESILNGLEQTISQYPQQILPASLNLDVLDTVEAKIQSFVIDLRNLDEDFNAFYAEIHQTNMVRFFIERFTIVEYAYKNKIEQFGSLLAVISPVIPVPVEQTYDTLTLYSEALESYMAQMIDRLAALQGKTPSTELLQILITAHDLRIRETSQSLYAVEQRRRNAAQAHQQLPPNMDNHDLGQAHAPAADEINDGLQQVAQHGLFQPIAAPIVAAPAGGPSDPNPYGSNVAEDQSFNFWGILLDATKLLLWAALLGGSIYIALTSSLIYGAIGISIMLGVGIYSCVSNEPQRQPAI